LVVLSTLCMPHRMAASYVTLIGEFTGVESGKNSDRPQLRAAQAACKKHKAKLVSAKLDRLSRNVAFIANLWLLIASRPMCARSSARYRKAVSAASAEPPRRCPRVV
jgi:hypothetical protein